jgi:hypothetical protein
MVDLRKTSRAFDEFLNDPQAQKKTREILEREQAKVIENATADLAFFAQQNEELKRALSEVAEAGRQQISQMELQTKETGKIGKNFKEIIGKEDQQGTFNNLLKNMNLALPFVVTGIGAIDKIMEFAVAMNPLAENMNILSAEMQSETIESATRAFEAMYDLFHTEAAQGTINRFTSEVNASLTAVTLLTRSLESLQKLTGQTDDKITTLFNNWSLAMGKFIETGGAFDYWLAKIIEHLLSATNSGAGGIGQAFNTSLRRR